MIFVTEIYKMMYREIFVFKPMPTKKFKKWIQGFGWHIEKGGTDWHIYDENENYVCTVVLQHPGEDVVKATSVKNFQKHLRERGFYDDRP